MPVDEGRWKKRLTSSTIIILKNLTRSQTYTPKADEAVKVRQLHIAGVTEMEMRLYST
jgi:hypothetical protein